MNRPRFLEFRNQVAQYVQSVGSPLGGCVGNIPALSGLVNIATQRWLYDPLQPEEGWWFTWQRMVFNVSSGNPYITTPYEFARIILMDVCRKPTKIQNGFYEFLDYGLGLQPKACGTTKCDGLMQAYDREFTPILGTLNPTPQIIRLFPLDSRDINKIVIVQGTDQNGQIITGTDPVTNQTILGEIIVLALPFSNSINTFATITGIQKDNTVGSVTIQQVDPVSGANVALSSMGPTETNAAYRRYLINNLPCNCCDTANGVTQVTAMCKLDYVPVSSDSDNLIIPNIPALLSECESIRYGAIDNIKAQALADKKHAEAAKLLFGQISHYMGNERPAISVSLFGPRKSLRPQPV